MRLRYLISLGLLAAIGTSAFGETPRAAMERLTNEFLKATRTSDIGWFERTAAKDFHEIGLKGQKTTRAQSMAQMREMFKMGPPKSVSAKVLSVKTKGKQTITTSDMHMVMVVKAPDGSKPMTYDTRMTIQETWTNEGGKWQLHELRSIKEKSLINGKEVKGGM